MYVLSVVLDIKDQSPSYRTAMAKPKQKCMQNADTNFLETKIWLKTSLNIGIKASLLDGVKNAMHIL